jgi:hypothetical protein
MSNWSIYILESNSSYTDDGYIPRPNQDLETSRVSTQQQIRMADGSNSYVTPEVKSLKDPIQMFFADVSTSLITKINNYIDNGDTVKIVTHTGEEFIGYFTSIKRVWLTGVAPDSYNIQVDLVITE